MNDRASSMAQLSRWTDAMKSDGTKGPPAAETKPSGVSLSGSKNIPVAKPPSGHEPRKQTSTVEEDYEEEFEDYDEDFEEEGSPAKPSSKPVVAPSQQPSLAPPKPLPTSFAPTPALDLKSSHSRDAERSSQVPPLATADAKKLQRDREDAVPKTARRSLENITSSLARSIADPRSMRVQRIMNSKVLDLHSEKFTQLTLLPSTPYEFYNNILRKPNAHIKQVGVPVDQEIREMEVNTEEIGMKDEVVQASFEDDTKFFKVLDDIRQRRKKGGEHTMKDIVDMDSLRNLAPVDSSIPGAEERGTGSLSSFLQRASGVVEGVLDSERSVKDIDNKATASRSSQSSILDSAAIAFGTDKSKGENELIRMRATSFVRFSSVQTHMLLSVHPYPLEDNENDLLPEKGLIGLWDLVTSSGAPLYILESTSQVTCACFSSTQTHIVVAGTWDGSIHLWDMRESSSLHHDKDSQDLKIAKGIRKPTYSSHPSLSLDEYHSSDSQTSHSSSIIQIEAIGDNVQNSIAVSQFCSIDEHGLVIFWVTSEVSSQGNSDLKRSPWGRVVLTPTKSMALQTTFIVPQITCGVLDVNSLLVAGWKGELRRMIRMGEVVGPKSYYSHNADLNHVTCVDIKVAATSSEAPLILVGRDSGVVDLYDVSKAFPIASWDIASLDKNASLVRVILVKWMIDGSFLAVSNKGLVACYNLLQDMYHPVLVESVGFKNLRKGELDISVMRNRLDICRLVTCNGKENKLSLSGRKINTNVFPATKEGNEALADVLNHFIVPKVAESKPTDAGGKRKDNIDSK